MIHPHPGDSGRFEGHTEAAMERFETVMTEIGAASLQPPFHAHDALGKDDASKFRIVLVNRENFLRAKQLPKIRDNMYMYRLQMESGKHL